MKKIVLISLFALSGIFSFSGISLFAQNANVEELSKKVADLEKALSAADDAMLGIMDKNMAIIGKLRSENRELRARVAELEKQLAASPEAFSKKSVYESTKKGIKDSRQSNTELSVDANAPFDALKSDKDSVYSKSDKAKIKAAREAAEAEKEAKAPKKGADSKDDSVWDHIFPF